MRLDKTWFIACMSRELRHKPIARTIQGVPLALFRDRNGVDRRVGGTTIRPVAGR